MTQHISPHFSLNIFWCTYFFLNYMVGQWDTLVMCTLSSSRRVLGWYSWHWLPKPICSMHILFLISPLWFWFAFIVHHEYSLMCYISYHYQPFFSSYLSSSLLLEFLKFLNYSQQVYFSLTWLNCISCESEVVKIFTIYLDSNVNFFFFF